MSVTLTKNLKLKIDSSFDDVSRYNLNRIDTLASILQVNTNNEAVIRSQTDIQFLPNSADIGGSGVGGSVQLGSVDQPLDTFTINASSVNFSGGIISLKDQAVGGTKSLLLTYKSDLDGLLDSVADRTLSIDLNASNRELVLGANLSVTGTDFNVNTATLTNGQVLTYNSISSNWENQDASGGGGDSSRVVATWTPSDGASKVINHGLSSTAVTVQLYNESGATIEIDSVVRTDANNVTLTASRAPTGTWTALIQRYN